MKTIQELADYLLQRLSTGAYSKIECVIDAGLAEDIVKLSNEQNENPVRTSAPVTPSTRKPLYNRKECPLRSEMGRCFAAGEICIKIEQRYCSVYQAIYEAGKRSVERKTGGSPSDENAADLLKRVYEAQSALDDRNQGYAKAVISSVLSEVAVYLEEHTGRNNT